MFGLVKQYMQGFLEGTLNLIPYITSLYALQSQHPEVAPTLPLRSLIRAPPVVP